jgi:hypothetical protein
MKSTFVESIAASPNKGKFQFTLNHYTFVKRSKNRKAAAYNKPRGLEKKAANLPAIGKAGTVSCPTSSSIRPAR